MFRVHVEDDFFPIVTYLMLLVKSYIHIIRRTQKKLWDSLWNFFKLFISRFMSESHSLKTENSWTRCRLEFCRNNYVQCSARGELHRIRITVKKLWIVKIPNLQHQQHTINSANKPNSIWLLKSRLAAALTFQLEIRAISTIQHH